jgi:protein TonB
MLSQPFSVAQFNSEDQFVGDLANLCRRHNVHCGTASDLDHLGADLTFNEAFQSDLFALCTAIGHMAPVEPTPDQLLALITRAVGGPDISMQNSVAQPQELRSAFFALHDSWLHRESDLDQFIEDPPPTYPEPLSPQPHIPSYFAASARATATAVPQFNESLVPAPTAPHPATPIPSNSLTNAALSSLTLNELRSYLEDIERRVSRIEPRLESIVPLTHLPPEQLQTLSSIEPPPTPKAPPAAQESATTFAQAVSSLPSAITPIPKQETLAPLATIQPLEANPDAARFRRLRWANAILATLLIIATTFAAVLAYRYLYPRPASSPLANDQNRPSQPASLQSPNQSLQPNTPLAAPSLSPAAKPSPRILAPLASPDSQLLPTKQKTDAPLIETSYTTSTAPPQTFSPTPISMAASTPTPLPETLLHSQPHVTASPIIPDQHPRPAEKPGDHPASAEPTRTLATNSAPSAAHPADTRPPAPILRSAPPANLRIAVPSATMMSYALSAPLPHYQNVRHIQTETSVLVQLQISKDGKVTGAQATTGNYDARTIAVQAVQNWRFKPYSVDGKPVEVATTVKFVFKP